MRCQNVIYYCGLPHKNMQHRTCPDDGKLLSGDFGTGKRLTDTRYDYIITACGGWVRGGVYTEVGAIARD